MNLGQLIAFLESMPMDAVVRNGFGRPRSYRGYYDQVAFEPVEEATIGDMLAHAKAAMGKTFHGYKGGDYRYDLGTECWIAPWGETVDDPITKAQCELWRADIQTPVPAPVVPSEEEIGAWIKRIAAARFSGDSVAFDAAVFAGCALMRRAAASPTEPSSGLLREWCLQHGRSLCPTAGSADTFGDGMREAKRQVSAILDRCAADPAPEPADAEAPKGHLWLVQLASDTDEACAWERAFDNLILKMSRQGRLVGDEPERLGFLVRRGVQLMRQDHNEKNDAEADRSRDREPIPLPPAEDGQPSREAQHRDRGMSRAGEEAARSVSGGPRAGDRTDEVGGSSHVGEPIAGMRLADGRVAPSAPDPAVGAEIEAAITGLHTEAVRYGTALASRDGDLYTPTERIGKAKSNLRALIAKAIAEAEARAVGDGKSLDRERLGSALSLALLTFGPTPIPYLLEDCAVAVAERCRVAIAQMENGAELRHKLEQNYNAIDRDNEALRKERDEARAEVERLKAGGCSGDFKSVAEAMLARWRERRARCLNGVAPTLAEIQAAMPSWTNEVVAQESAPRGSAMRRTIDAADRIIDMLWKHSETLRERFDYEMEQRDELHAALVKTTDERDDARAELARLRAGGCARDQRTTQFCAEAVALQRENERLRAQVAKLREALAWIETEATQRQLVAIRDRAFNALAAEKEDK